jgi:hypothetical protein
MFRMLSILVVFFCQMLSAVCPFGAQASSIGDATMPVAAVKYVGNCDSHKFHRPSCPFAKQIAGKRLIRFQFRQQAIDDHYSPCQYCLPRVWLSVHACIISTPKPKLENTIRPVPE